MKSHADPTPQQEHKIVDNDVNQPISQAPFSQFADKRLEAVAQRKLQQMANNSSRVMRIYQYSDCTKL